MSRLLLAASLLAAACAAAVTAARHPAAATGQLSERTGEIIVRFRDGTSLAGVARALTDSSTDPTASTAGSKLVLVRPHIGQTVDDALAALRARSDVLFAESNLTVRAVDTVPTDPYYASYQWNLPQIGLPQAWDTTTGSSSVIVAVIDTGVDATRPDLTGRITTGGAAGYDFVNSDANPDDDHGHGTFVAGIVAASTNNGQGMAGICWSCQVMPLKALDATGTGNMFTVAQSIDYAVANGAKIINLSLGGSAGTAALQTAVDNAWNAGVVVIAASGNDGGPVLYPAAYTNAIAVGANDSTGARASFSNFGPELDLVAPGVNVMGTLCLCNGSPGTYGTGSGTSFASPHVAGVAALLVASGVTDKQQMRDRLVQTATDAGAAGFDNYYGNGRVNAAAAITPPPPYSVTWGANSVSSSLSANQTFGIAVSFTNNGSLTWPSGGANPVRFSYHWKNGACAGSSIAIYNGMRTVLASDVASSGGVSSLLASIRTPAAAGTYCLVYDLVHEGVTWFSTQGAATQTFTVNVTMPLYAVTWGSDTTPSNAAPDTTITPQLSFTNAGSLTWNAGGVNPVRLSYHWKNGACPGTSTAIFDGQRTLLPADTPSGASVSNLTASVRTPAAPGTYCLVYDLVREGVTWFSTQGAATRTKTMTVATPQYAVTWGAHDTPPSVTASSSNTVTITFTNAGSLTWPSGGANSVRFSYHWLNGACPGSGTSVWNGVRTLLPSDVTAGGTVSSLSTTVVAPAAVGTYCLVYDPVHEGVTWFSTQGAATLKTTVTVS